MTDALGNPIEILLSEGKIHDSKVAIDLLQNVYSTKVISSETVLFIVNQILIIPSSLGHLGVKKKGYQRYTKEFKDTAVKLCLQSDVNRREIADNLGVKYKTISAYLGMIKLTC